MGNHQHPLLFARQVTDEGNNTFMKEWNMQYVMYLFPFHPYEASSSSANCGSSEAKHCSYSLCRNQACCSELHSKCPHPLTLRPYCLADFQNFGIPVYFSHFTSLGSTSSSLSYKFDRIQEDITSDPRSSTVNQNQSAWRSFPQYLAPSDYPSVSHDSSGFYFSPASC